MNQGVIWVSPSSVPGPASRLQLDGTSYRSTTSYITPSHGSPCLCNETSVPGAKGPPESTNAYVTLPSDSCTEASCRVAPHALPTLTAPVETTTPFTIAPDDSARHHA